MGVRSGETCHYECDPGYRRGTEAVCLSNGTLVGGSCERLQCTAVVISHSDRSQTSTACNGTTGSICEFNCDSGYVRAPTSFGPLICNPPAVLGRQPVFVTDFAFRIVGANHTEYDGIYTKTNHSCSGQPIWQRHPGNNGTAVGPVLFAWSGHGIYWAIGPSARVGDCSTTDADIHASTIATTQVMVGSSDSEFFLN
jgi:hypothetical protein